MTDNHEWQREVSERLKGIETKLEPLERLDGRLRTIENAYQQGRGALVVVGFMGLTGVAAFLAWLARLAGLVRP